MEENFKNNEQEQSLLEIRIVCPFKEIENSDKPVDVDEHWDVPYYSVRETSKDDKDVWIFDTIGFNFIEKISFSDYCEKYFEGVTPSISTVIEGEIISSYLFTKDIIERENLEEDGTEVREIDTIDEFKQSPEEREAIIKSRYESYLEKMNVKYRGKYICKENSKRTTFIKIDNLRIDFNYCKYYPDLFIDGHRVSFVKDYSNNSKIFTISVSENTDCTYYEGNFPTALFRFQRSREFPVMFESSEIIETEEDFTNRIRSTYKDFSNDEDSAISKSFGI